MEAGQHTRAAPRLLLSPYLLQNSSRATLSTLAMPPDWFAAGSELAAVAKHTRLPFLRSVSQISMRLRLISTAFA